ncbi:MAG TPA: hypothetical protein VLH84_01150 [Patescibacteria group bacterium]|nr:hypothetical protein [Patescibacteria group bacterium]
MNNASESREAGFVGGAAIGLGVCIMLLIAALSFGAWAFSSRSYYKTSSDAISKTAAAAAVTKTQATDAATYAQEAKSPLTSYVGPSQYGSITVKYPKTWSAYVVGGSNGATQPLNAYFAPSVVPDVAAQDSVYSLRIQILQQPYDQVLQQYNTQLTGGKLAAKAYALSKVPSVVGVRFDGQIGTNQQGSTIIFPLRNVTLQISTQSLTYESDFDTFILPNLSFSP